MTDFTWSNSKHKSFEDCRRAWYWNYYGFQTNPQAKKLKYLTNVLFWGGNLVHNALERYLKDLQAGENPITTPEAIDAFIRNVTHVVARNDWQMSEANRGRFRLFEHHYGVPVSQEDKKVLIGLVATCLKNFFASEMHAEIANGDIEFLTIEDLFKFEVEGITVTGKMDLAYRRRSDGRVIIVDWKTAKNPDSWTAINKVQVAVYALYAFQAGWAEKVDQIDTVLAYLAIPEWKKRVLTLEDFCEAKDFVKKSGTAMLQMVGDEPNIEDFPQCGVNWKCKRCFFREMCFPKWDGR